jgi:hypothetical protein
MAIEQISKDTQQEWGIFDSDIHQRKPGWKML